MKLGVLWFGRPTQSPYEAEVERYRRRVSRRWPATDQALKPAQGGRAADSARARAAEAAALAQHLNEGWRVVALDEAGDRVDSAAFAHRVAGLEASGAPGVTFVIGSDLGLDPPLKARADARISLSPMTLPHLLARLLLWEQLFRATHILSGGAYHRATPDR